MNRAREASKRAFSSQLNKRYTSARNIYFQAIKTAKKDHWNYLYKVKAPELDVIHRLRLVAIAKASTRQSKTSLFYTLLLDVKGLLTILKDLAFPNSVIKWVLSFISGRLYAVKFISYINNITLSFISTSPCKNVKILQLVAKELFQLASKNGIQFNPKKSKLIHFSIGERAKLAPLILLDRTIVLLKQTVKWLGIYFNALLQFKEHITIYTAKAKSIFRPYPTIHHRFGGKAKHTQKTTYSTSKIWHYAKS
ncbi:hypothetical protein LHYA1_G009140 [Lachnellula hyalina]|uniref:Uncharacterized protein n=1 Tax=Lachnellula hyalina TaxID=1316788 RepID=A0A8H8QSU5_9HELO|nr:uncharacterized protein LHYA1_G009140 [Lachnellula hyalina]TVY22109.1 hypothetical protein LHYA1_G009140 [Lachnellula hyalina]